VYSGIQKRADDTRCRARGLAAKRLCAYCLLTLLTCKLVVEGREADGERLQRGDGPLVVHGECVLAHLAELQNDVLLVEIRHLWGADFTQTATNESADKQARSTRGMRAQ